MKIYTVKEFLIKGRHHCFLAFFLLSTLFAFGNPGHEAASPSGADTSRKRTQTGLASYYAKSLQGEATASGEAFDNRYLVAAHPTFPMGTIVRVTNLKNDNSVLVRINDRGPAKKIRKRGVIIDLSWAAAKRLDMLEDGRVKVRVDVQEWGGGEPKKGTIIGKIVRRDKDKEKVKEKKEKVKEKKKRTRE